MIFDPVHYLPLLENKIGALDLAARLAGWEQQAEFQTLRRLMEARMIRAGRRLSSIHRVSDGTPSATKAVLATKGGAGCQD